jgi:chromosome segregation ATPase
MDVSCLSCNLLRKRQGTKTAQLVELNEKFKKQSEELEKLKRIVEEFSPTFKRLADEYHGLYEALTKYEAKVPETTSDESNKETAFESRSTNKPASKKMKAQASETTSDLSNKETTFESRSTNKSASKINYKFYWH